MLNRIILESGQLQLRRALSRPEGVRFQELLMYYSGLPHISLAVKLEVETKNTWERDGSFRPKNRLKMGFNNPSPPPSPPPLTMGRTESWGCRDGPVGGESARLSPLTACNSGSLPQVVWVCRWLSPCFEGFSAGSVFSFLHKNQHLQILIRPG